MQGYVLTEYGDATAMQMRDVPVPAVSPDDVLIKVHAAGLNPLDIKLRDGVLRPLLKLDLPRVAGNELAGVVHEVGSGVTRFAVGDRVFARIDEGRLGAFGQYVAVSAGLVANMPESLTFVEAAGLPLAGETSIQALRDKLHVKAGQKVFIAGGAGGVGTLAIQIARWMGAHVATTASGKGAELVRSLGAETVIDYTRDRFVDVLHHYDAALDLRGGQDLIDCFSIVKPGGTVVSLAGMPEPKTALKDLDRGAGLATLLWFASAKVRWQAQQRKARYRFLFMRPDGTDLELLARLVDERTIIPVIDRVFSFDRIDHAFSYVEGGHAKGKVIVQLES